MQQIIIGVDPHKLSATIEVVNDRERFLGSGRFATDQAGYTAMLDYAKVWPERIWAVEGANGAGRPLAQRLLEAGESVVDVPAKLAARVRLFDTGHNRKTDALDAHSIAVVAVRTEGLRVLKVDGELEAMRMLTDRREALARRRVQTVNRLQALLAELLPGQAKKDITPLQAKAMLASVRPRDIAGKTRRSIAAEELAELIAVDAKTKKATAELKVMVLARGSRLMDLRGVGPVVAARVLADVGDVARFADRNRFASWTGTAPLDASSGEQKPAPPLPGREPADEPHDPHRCGHPAAPEHRGTRLLPAQAVRGQEADGGDALPEATDLRRHLPPAGRRCAAAGRRGPGRALRGDSRIQRGRPAPAHRHFGSATSRTRTPDATRHQDPCEPPRGVGSSPSAPTRRSRQGGAPHRTNDLDGDKRRRTLQGAENAALTTEGSRNDAGGKQSDRGIFGRESGSPGVAGSVLARHVYEEVRDNGRVEAEYQEAAVIVVRDHTCGGLGVRAPAPPLPPEQLVKACRASGRKKRNRPTRGDLRPEPFHNSSTDAFGLALRVGRHAFDVTDGAPRLVPEPDPTRHSAGVSDEALSIASHHVYTTVGVVCIVVVEAVAERPVPERPQG
jgi:transposase